MNHRIVFALLLFSVLMGGCNRSHKRVIAVVPKGTSHLFWVSVHAGAVAAGQDLGVEILWNGANDETEYSRQIQIVNSMVARRVNGLAVAAADGNALVKPVNRAVAAGIPVTIFDSGLDSGNYTSFVATDNVEAGRMAARTLAGLIGGKGKVGVVLHTTGSYSTMERERGFDETMAREYPGIQVVARQYGLSDRSKAYAAAEDILAANPGINGLFASTEPSAAGVSLALKGHDLMGKVKFVGFDSSEMMIEDMKAGVMQATVVQDPFHIGYMAVKTLVDKLNGKTPPRRIDLPARVVTLENMDKPEIQSLLRPNITKYLNK